MVKNSIISETGPEQQMYFVHVVVHEYPPSCQIGAMQLLRPGGTYGGEWGFVPICFWQIFNPITMRILNKANLLQKLKAFVKALKNIFAY